MTVRARFRLDDEATDTPHITEQLAALKREVPGRAERGRASATDAAA
jgi:hypothetical protein